MSEVVTHEKNFAPQIFEWTQSIEALNDPVTRRDYFEHMSQEDFFSMTEQLESIIRTGDSNMRQHFDGDSVRLMFHQVPDHRDKEELLRETWDTARGLLKDRTISDDDALEYAALTVAGGLLYVHPFIDGNGRASRYMSYIIAKGGQNKDDLESMWDSLSATWKVTPPRQLAFEEDLNFTSEQPDQIDWKFHLADEGVDALDGKVVNSDYKTKIIRKFIELTANDPKTCGIIESVATRDQQGRLVSLNGDRLVEILVTEPDQGIRNAQLLIDLERGARAEYVRGFLSAMQSKVQEPLYSIDESELQHSGTGERRKARVTAMAGIVAARSIVTEDGLPKILPRDELVAHHHGYSRLHNGFKPNENKLA